MRKHSQYLTYGAIIAALYAVLTHIQNLLLPGSATWAIQFRASEALCVLALFTPAAAPGLTVGCLVFNLTFAGALPLDFLVGSLATWLAAVCMRRFARITVRGIPVVSLAMPALWNGLLVGAELSAVIGGGFWINALYVAIGELAVLFSLGLAVWYAMKKQRLEIRFF